LDSESKKVEDLEKDMKTAEEDITKNKNSISILEILSAKTEKDLTDLKTSLAAD